MKSGNLLFLFTALMLVFAPWVVHARQPLTLSSNNEASAKAATSTAEGPSSAMNSLAEADAPAAVYSPGADSLGIVLDLLDDDIRFPTLPYYTYGSGLGITSPDSTFRMNIRFRMQNRSTLNLNDGRDDTVEGVVRRLRLRFDGFVGNPKFLYAIQLSFSPGDVGTLRDGDGINIIRDAMFFYRPNPRINLGFGQTKLPGNRQRLNSSGALQLTDRSINNARFTIDRDYGVHAYYLNEYDDAFSWNIKTAVSTGNGRNWTRNLSTDLAYTGRVEVMPFGEMGMFFEGDIRRNQTPKLLLSATYHLNQGAQRTGGQTGGSLFDTRDLTSFFFDGMFKYQGFSAMYAYMLRSVDGTAITAEFPDQMMLSNLAPDLIMPAVGSYSAVFAGDGHDVQLSYLFRSNYELITRYSVQTVLRDVAAVYPDRNQLSFGVTRYIWEHSLKLQGEVTRTRSDWRFGNQPDREDWYLRFQVEIGI
ncbi:MAG: phosphate-selective porin [Bacteroidetes bacterium HLUCCA01]|nr:MAG: phosphate-selective porin [Bacteroidetes bacterium HLUCCA01]